MVEEGSTAATGSQNNASSSNNDGREMLPDLTLRESDIWVFNCAGSLYFIRTNSYDDAEKKCRAAQLKDGIKEPVMSVGHKILIWE